MKRAGRAVLERLKGEGVRFARSKPGEKVPADAGWKDSEISIEDIRQAYDEDRFAIAILAGSGLAVVDIDDPKHDHSIALMNVMDAAGVARAESRKGFHYWLRRDRDLDALLDGRERIDLMGSTRKDAKKVGDLLGGAAVAYHLEGEFMGVAAVSGLYSLLSNSDIPAPTIRAAAILDESVAAVRALEAGNRNNGMFALLSQTNRRLKRAGLGWGWWKVSRKMVSVYEREVNPEDTGFTAERLDAIDAHIGQVTAVEGGDDDVDISEAVLESYLGEHDGYVIVDADGSRDDLRAVYEWQTGSREWTRRGMGVRGETQDSVMCSIGEMFTQTYRDAYGRTPTLARQNSAVSDVVTKMKHLVMQASPRSTFDQEINGVTRIRTSDFAGGEVYEIVPNRPRSERLVKLDGCRPEFRMLATLGDVSVNKSEAWERFLIQVLGDSQILTYFSDLVASAFIPSASPMFILCNGAGANGKSVLLTTLAAALNDYACVSTDDAFSSGLGQDHKRRLDSRSSMLGKRVAVCTESGNTPLDLTFIKALTSGEMVEVGGMYKASSHVRMRVFPFVATNNLPRIFEVSHAVRRRIMVVPFTKTFGDKSKGADEDADPHLMEKLLSELPGIRRWLFDSIQDLLDRDCKVAVPEAVRSVTEAYMEGNRNQFEALTADWLERLPADCRPLKLGAKTGRGAKAEYSGFMGLLMTYYERANMSGKAPSRSFIENVCLAPHSINVDSRGRMNARVTPAAKAFIVEALSRTDGEALWHSLAPANPLAGKSGEGDLGSPPPWEGGEAPPAVAPPDLENLGQVW